MKRFALILTVSACLAGVEAGAGMVTFTETIVASGSLGTQTFTNATVTLTLVSDTSQVFLLSSPPNIIYDTPDTTARLAISGIGSATFTDQFSVFDNQTVTDAGFYDASNPSNLLFDISTPPFGAYNLQSSIGPVIGSSYLDTGSIYGTSAGNLIFSTGATTTTFSAVAPTSVPEPCSLVLCLSAVLVGLGYARRKRA